MSGPTSAGCGLPRAWRTSTVGNVVLGFDERALRGAMRRSPTGSRRKLELGLGSIRLSGSAVYACPREGVVMRHCSSVKRVLGHAHSRRWGCSPRSQASRGLRGGVAAAEYRHNRRSSPPPSTQAPSPDRTAGGAPSRATSRAFPLGYDQEVEANAGAPATFGAAVAGACRTVLRAASSDPQTYSTPVDPPAGETGQHRVSSPRFSFISKTPGADQDGLS